MDGQRFQRDELPYRLVERTRLVSEGDRGDGEFVLYWMHHAMRSHENPSLDVAVTTANRRNLPVLVYQSLPSRYPFASDRHHTFLLEGARDLQEQFDERGIQYVVHIERAGSEGGHLADLCRRAALIVTDEMPVEPFRSWIASVPSQGATVLAVDSACVVPMQVVGRSYDRAFRFRQATEREYAQRVPQTWSDAVPNVTRFIDDLPFESVNLRECDLPELVSRCEVDHTIGPVPHTVGGSAAGYARWDRFRQSKLSSYDKKRNDPLLDGTSRLSAYLHFGMVSPMRIAREADAANNSGGEKYLDELLIWRELAYAFCFYRDEHDNLSALPKWAQETLLQHAQDPRPVLHSWETLARGTTGDQLWDAAQKSLLIHGELHNNVRMTWGKSILPWTPDPQSALDTIFDLNHRFALDGNDPASYGGILWCLGQFDRPFPPDRPIAGTVRERTTQTHSSWLDPAEYLRQTTRPLFDEAPRIAIVGAGIAGLTCARTLHDHGISVTVFEKSRGVGGRMATRRVDPLRFDHGAQYFTVRDQRFERLVHSWVKDGVVAAWNGKIATLKPGEVEFKTSTTARFVGCPGMNAICRHLARDIPVEFQTRIGSAEFDGRRWHLSDDRSQSLGEFDYLISSAPAMQTGELLASVPELSASALATPMDGCWAVMLSFAHPLPLEFDGAFVHESPLSWIARNASKPQRDESAETWVIHASSQWSNEWIDAEPGEVLPRLLDAFWQATGLAAHQPVSAAAHRWRFAIPSEPLADPCLFDADHQAGACGDWCGGPRVEGAFLSGAAMAGRVLGHVSAAVRKSDLAEV